MEVAGAAGDTVFFSALAAGYQKHPWEEDIHHSIWVWVKIEYPNSWMVNTKNRLKSVVPQVLHFDSYPFEKQL